MNRSDPSESQGEEKPSKGPLALAILIISVGIGWLLTAKGFGQDINWVWTLGLAALGIMTFVLSGGLDKVSVIVGPMFLVASFLSIFRQAKMLNGDTEVPILVIVLGVMLLAAQARFVPVPGWLLPLPPGK
jgi:hypothetical protein